MLKNRIHVILIRYGISIDNTDIFGRSDGREIEKSSSKLGTEDRFVLSDILEMIDDLIGDQWLRRSYRDLWRIVKCETAITIPEFKIY